MKTAAVIFVKTPGHSPVKTRLPIRCAQSVKKLQYLSAISVYTTLERHSKIDTIWSVAKKQH